MKAYFKGRIKLGGDVMVAAKLASLFRMPGARARRQPARGNGTRQTSNALYRAQRVRPQAGRPLFSETCGRDARAIELLSVVKRYGEIVAVDGFDLTVPPGICFGLLGPNGAGKSTTMRMLTAQTLADEGTIEVLGFGSRGSQSRRGWRWASCRSSTTSTSSSPAARS